MIPWFHVINQLKTIHNNDVNSKLEKYPIEELKRKEVNFPNDFRLPLFHWEYGSAMNPDGRQCTGSGCIVKVYRKFWVKRSNGQEKFDDGDKNNIIQKTVETQERQPIRNNRMNAQVSIIIL